MFGNRTEVMKTEQGKAKNKFQKDAGGIINVNGVLNRIQEGIFQAAANPAFLSFYMWREEIKWGVKKRLEDDLPTVGDDAQLEQIIGGLQKAIQDPVLRMEGNKLGYLPNDDFVGNDSVFRRSN